MLAKVGFRRLRLFELDDGIVVEIHRLQRADWTGRPGARERSAPTPALAPERRNTVRRGSRLAVADRAARRAVVYDVVLLAGSPRRYTLQLAPDLAEGSVIEVDGEQWTVADVRPRRCARRS